MRKKINLGVYSDETRKMFLQYEGDKIYLMQQDMEGLEETGTEYSFEAFIRTYRFMDRFFNELCLNDKEALLKLSKINKINYKMIFSYV